MGAEAAGSRAPGAQHAYQLPGPGRLRRLELENELWGWGGGCRTSASTFNCDSAESVAALQWAQDAIYKDKPG